MSVRPWAAILLVVVGVAAIAAMLPLWPELVAVGGGFSSRGASLCFGSVVVNCDPRPFAGQAERDCATDSFCAAGDQDHLPVEWRHESYNVNFFTWILASSNTPRPSEAAISMCST